MGFLSNLFSNKQKKPDSSDVEQDEYDRLLNDPEIGAMLTETRNAIVKQDQQIEDFSKAETLAKEGSVDEAIKIIERIMHDEGLVVNGVRWPFVLSDIYIQQKMYDKGFKYLSFVYENFPDSRARARVDQARILKAEKRHLDALAMQMTGLLITNTERGYKAPYETIEKSLKTFIKNAELVDHSEDLMKLYFNHMNKDRFSEVDFRQELKSFLKEWRDQ